MNGHLSYITLAVSDVSRAASFYVRLFDWPQPRNVGPALFFELPPVTIALIERNAAQTFCGESFPGTPPPTGLFSWNVNSRERVDELLRHAGELQATITKPARELEWGGYAGIMRSPDGHLWEIVWNPRFATD